MHGQTYIKWCVIVRFLPRFCSQNNTVKWRMKNLDVITCVDWCLYVKIDTLFEMVFTMLCVKFMERVQWIAALCHGGHLVSMKVRQVSKVIQKTLWPGGRPLLAFYRNVDSLFPVAVMALVTLPHPMKHLKFLFL